MPRSTVRTSIRRDDRSNAQPAIRHPHRSTIYTETLNIRWPASVRMAGCRSPRASRAPDHHRGRWPRYRYRAADPEVTPMADEAKLRSLSAARAKLDLVFELGCRPGTCGIGDFGRWAWTCRRRDRADRRARRARQHAGQGSAHRYPGVPLTLSRSSSTIVVGVTASASLCQSIEERSSPSAARRSVHLQWRLPV